MDKIVIAGSASLQEEISSLIKNLEEKYLVLDYPKTIPEDRFFDLYPSRHKEFFENIKNSDVFLLFNHDKKGVEGYIGAESFAELCFSLALNLVYNKNIKLYIYKLPSKEVNSYNEIDLWLKLGWIRLWNEKKLKN